MNFGADPKAAGGLHRLFYALWPSAEIREELVACTRSLAGIARGKWVSREHLHVTLRFLGAVDDAGLQQRLDGPPSAESAFALELAVLRHRRRQCLIWVEARTVPGAFAGLVAGLKGGRPSGSGAGEPRTLIPHVTLGRKVTVESALPERIVPIVWPVDSYVLVESVLQPSGPKYRVLQTWSLRSMPTAGSVK
jgi:2'-5' RNA ligase